MYHKKIKINLIVHDLKSPLAVVETGVRSLLEKPEKYGVLTESQQKILKRTLRNVRSAQALVNDVLELGKSEAGIVALKKIHLSDLMMQMLLELFDYVDGDISDNLRGCTDLTNLKAILKKSGIVLDLDERFWNRELLLDQTKIKQILRNLLNNALKYRKTSVELKIDIKENHLFLAVIDDGDGIPAAYHKKIFESYFQLESKAAGFVRGDGLGLAGVKVLVEDLGGKLSLISEKGKGTQFVVELPFPNPT